MGTNTLATNLIGDSMSRRSVVVVVAGALLAPAFTFGQAANPNRPPNGGGQSGHAGQVDPAKFEQAIYDAIKEKLDVTEAEWDAIQPKLETVRQAQANTRSGAGMGIASAQGGVARAQSGANVDTPLGHAMSDLRTALDEKDASVEDLVKKMAAVREAREKAREELKKAEEDLKTSITPRQQAILITLGQLE
jgi:Spy/CpxP family protein refolding chaperone